MSWQPKTQDNLIKQLIREQNNLRDVVYRTQFGHFSGGGVGGLGGFGSGGALGSQTINHYHPISTAVSNIKGDDSVDSTDGYSHIRANNTIIVCEEAGSGNTPSDTNPQVKWIDQTLFDGTLLILTPKEGKTLTLIAGGNINIASNTTVSSDEIIYLIYLDEHPSSGSGTGGSYNLLKTTSGGGADNLGNHTATTNLNMAGNQINRIDQLWFDTDDQNDASIQASSNGLAYVSDNDDTGTVHSFYTGGTGSSNLRLQIQDTSMLVKANLQMEDGHDISMVGAGCNMYMNGNSLYFDDDDDTRIIAGVDDQIEVECGASSGHFQVSTGGTLRFKVDNSNITLIGHTNIANLVGSQNTTIGYDETSFIYINGKITSHVGLHNTASIYAKESGHFCGFHCANNTGAGSVGTMEIPYKYISNGAQTPSDSTISGWFGSTSGCIGIYERSGDIRLYTRNRLGGWNWMHFDNTFT